MRRLVERKSVENSGIMVAFLQLNFIIVTVEEPALSPSLNLFRLPSLGNRTDISKTAVGHRVDNDCET